MGWFDIFRKKSATTNLAEKTTECSIAGITGKNADKCSSCGVEIPTTRTMCVSCEWAEKKFSDNREIFKMMTKEGKVHNFTNCGYTRYSPNQSSNCGYGSDDWLYLCEENGIHFLLKFSDDAGYGTGWMCTELLEGDFEILIKENINYWATIAFSQERTKIYAIRLIDVDSVRHLLPTRSCCCEKFTDEQYLR